MIPGPKRQRQGLHSQTSSQKQKQKKLGVVAGTFNPSTVRERQEGFCELKVSLVDKVPLQPELLKTTEKPSRNLPAPHQKE